MLGGIFYWILNMSIAASITGILILIIRKIKRIPRYVISIIWLIPIIRMVIPFGISSDYGLMSLISKYTTKTVIVYERKQFTLTAMNSIMGAEEYFPIEYKSNLLEEVLGVTSIIWLIISAAIIISLCIIYLITKKEISDAVKLKDNIYLSDKIQSPAVYGIIKPKIVLPASYKDKDLTFVRMHENAHIKRCDNLYRITAFTAVAIHWFNPLAWVFLKCILGDMELACDEKVLRNCGEESKKRYAASLVESFESKNLFASAFGGAKLRIRIENILSYRKLSAFSTAAFLAFAAVIAYTLLTNA